MSTIIYNWAPAVNDEARAIRLLCKAIEAVYNSGRQEAMRGIVDEVAQAVERMKGHIR